MSPFFGSWRVDLAPLIPVEAIAVLSGVSLLILVLSLFVYRRGTVWRTLCALLMIGALLNPSLIEEKREAVKDVAVMVIDQSPSQKFGNRREKTAAMQKALEETLKEQPDLDVRVVQAPEQSGANRQTDLFDAIRRAYADTPPSRRAGVIMLTDGQVHDVPSQTIDTGPIHVLLSGEKNEQDRQMIIVQAPTYGIVGQSVTVSFRVEDSGNFGSAYANVILRRDQGESEILSVPVGQDYEVSLPIDHGGKNIFEFESAPVPGELTEINNKAAIVINGVRDRLRVLLVSGQPHAGGRTWRNLLTSDPAVDLVHFTILRDPEKLDMTPQNELSLIPFPFHELFEVKLNEFDLIIFDRYSLNKILPPYYFENIARYIENGGALLEASGPEYASGTSLFETALGPILPGRPTGTVIERPYHPALTDLGRRHPVTEGLSTSEETWGNLLRQVDLRPAAQSDTLMTGSGGSPLLMLGHVGKGRIAQLASDQIWLWSRGYDGGGPQAELLRRLAHWLMKEPELEEEMLELVSDGNALLIRRRSLHDDGSVVTLTHPDGKREDITLSKTENSPFLQARVDVETPGVYGASDGDLKTLAVIGDLSAPEYKTILSSAEPTKSAVEQSGGSVRWMNDGAPEVRQVPEGRKFAGRGWIGLQKNNDYTVTGVNALPLMPLWLMLALLAGSTFWCWWRESRA
jgi:hypothetical protein